MNNDISLKRESSKLTRKRVLFYLVFIFCNAVIIIPPVFFLFRNYSIKIYSKHQMTDFSRRLALMKNKPTAWTEAEEKYIIPDFIDTRRPHPYCGYKAQPMTRNQDGSISHNQHGFRSPVLGAKSDNTIRIAIVGGSVAWDGSTNEKTIIARLAEQIKQRVGGKNIEYINAGIISGISNQELGVVVQDLTDMEVDLLVSFDGFNDILHIIQYNGRVGWPPFRWDPFSEENKMLSQAAPSYYLPVKPFRLTEEKYSAVLNNYLRNIITISIVCRGYGMKYIAVLQPWRDFNSEDIFTSDKLPPIAAFYREVIRTYNKWQQQHMNNGLYISMADIFRDRKEFFRDECHVQDEGNEIIAARLAEIISDNKLLSKDYGSSSDNKQTPKTDKSSIR